MRVRPPPRTKLAESIERLPQMWARALGARADDADRGGLADAVALAAEEIAVAALELRGVLDGHPGDTAAGRSRAADQVPTPLVGAFRSLVRATNRLGAIAAHTDPYDQVAYEVIVGALHRAHARFVEGTMARGGAR